MILFGGIKGQEIDLSKQPGVIEPWAALVNDKIIIYLKCKSGDEQLVFDSLPMWIHQMMKVTKSCDNVFIQAKK